MFSQYILCIHELLEAIVLDQDIIFKGYFWTSLFSRLGTKLTFSGREHSNTTGQTKWFKVLEYMFMDYVFIHQTNWESYLSLHQFVIAHKTTTKFTMVE